MKEFSFDQLSPAAVQGLRDMGITEPAKIQKLSIPSLLEGRDAVVISPAGTGKTLTYLIPAVSRLVPQGKGKHFPRVLIVVPTRELAMQSASVVRTLLGRQEGIRTAVLCGGEDIKEQIRRHSRGADIVIGTPSRLKDHIRRHTLKLKNCTYFAADEADEMLKMGFREDVIEIAGFLPEHQTVLLCATYTEETEECSRILLNDPEIFRNARSKEAAVPDLYCAVVPENRKLSALNGILRQFPGPAFIFCSRKKTADFTAEALRRNGCRTAVVHSDMDMAVRKKAMQDFRAGTIDAVCSTDVLARGIDVPAIPLCIHYDQPENKETLIHRTGRTARAGRKGVCVFLLTPKQKPFCQTIRRIFRKDIHFI